MTLRDEIQNAIHISEKYMDKVMAIIAERIPAGHYDDKRIEKDAEGLIRRYGGQSETKGYIILVDSMLPGTQPMCRLVLSGNYHEDSGPVIEALRNLLVKYAQRVRDETIEHLARTTKTESTSVLQPWVMSLPLRAQGTILTAIRGCDLVPKYPLDSPERELTGMIRHAVLNPADPREVTHGPGSFFRPGPGHDAYNYKNIGGKFLERFRFSALGHYPQHWLSHILHTVEVIGYNHPDDDARAQWCAFYYAFCHSLHLEHETKDRWLERMTEDRIKTNTVVS